MDALKSLRFIRAIHTLVWAFFAGAILAIPIAALQHRFDWVVMLAGGVMLEVAVLGLNHLRCPMTAMAARYTTDRRNNFDIYLPLWLATYNKQVFGTLYVAGVVFALILWTRR